VTADRRSPASRSAAASGDAADRTDDDRLADHAAIDRLADELVPALIAKLSASGLGEIEIGEGDWTIRVRRPADGAASSTRRSGDRASRAQPGQAGHGNAPGGFEGHRSARESRPAATAAAVSSNGSGPLGAPAGSAGRGGAQDGTDGHRSIATSPAVGIFQPRAEARAGTRVRSGDRLGAVDLLGVPQEVVAPADGIVGASLVEPGEAVEYGQELIVIELAARGGETARAGGDGGDRSEG
jgi:biotin carboxyl carrier protein